MEWDTILELISSGGWGVALICMYAISKKDNQLTKVREDTHNEMMALLKENIDLLSTIKDVMQDCKHKGDR